MIQKLEIKIKLTFKTPLHTTGNVFKWGVDKPTARAVDDNKGVILATTFKGVLRDEAETVLKSWNMAVCTGPTPNTMCLNTDVPCLVCRVFGNQRLKSRLKFHQVKPFGNTTDQVRSGVSISRRRRTAVPQRLFFIETIEAQPSRPEWGTIVKGIFPPDADQIASEAAALIVLAARATQRIGGGRSRGLGWIDSWQIDVTLNGVPLEKEQLYRFWQAWAKGEDQ